MATSHAIPLLAKRAEPDLSGFGGQPYRTCGSAYVIQKDVIPIADCQKSAEKRVLMVIEADLTNKGNVDDPMPAFKSVEQRLLDLTERKLHPFYKRYMSLPKKESTERESPEMPFLPYKCKVGPVTADEIPDNLKLNMQLLERKNVFADFKRIELPKQMIMRMVEMRKNKKPTLEQKEGK